MDMIHLQKTKTAFRRTSRSGTHKFKGNTSDVTHIYMAFAVAGECINDWDTLKTTEISTQRKKYLMTMTVKTRKNRTNKTKTKKTRLSSAEIIVWSYYRKRYMHDWVGNYSKRNCNIFLFFQKIRHVLSSIDTQLRGWKNEVSVIWN